MEEKKCYKCKFNQACGLQTISYATDAPHKDIFFRLLYQYFGIDQHDLAEKCILYDKKKGVD